MVDPQAAAHFRPAFERWATTEGNWLPHVLKERDGEGYSDQELQDQWAIWLAAGSLPFPARDRRISELIAAIYAARTMARRDSLFEEIIHAWENPETVEATASPIAIYQAKAPDARAWEDLPLATFKKAHRNNYETRILFGSPPVPAPAPPVVAAPALHYAYGIYYDGSGGGEAGWVRGESGPAQLGKSQCGNYANMPGYTVKRLALVEAPEDSEQSSVPGNGPLHPGMQARREPWTVEELSDFLHVPSKLDDARADAAARVLSLAIRGAPPSEALMFNIKRLQALLPKHHREHIQRHVDWHEAGREVVPVRAILPANASDDPAATAEVPLGEEPTLRVIKYIENLDGRLTAAGFTHDQKMTIVGLLMDRPAAVQASTEASVGIGGEGDLVGAPPVAAGSAVDSGKPTAPPVTKELIGAASQALLVLTKVKLPKGLASVVREIQENLDAQLRPFYGVWPYAEAVPAVRKSDGWSVEWKREGFNHCLRVAAEALSYLAEKSRPSNGEASFNSEHCHQLAHELRVTITDLLSPPPGAGQ